ncbi:MAG TPA: DUF6249 domain-containing protein [Vicinamibacterales bacterium]|jgi:hypothetical protein|nr:DUF6249 domain-containing protein [Vicinamibacterales bacterium]
MFLNWDLAWPFLIPITAIVASFVFAIVWTVTRARVRELEVRERIAMIERGLVPPPEVDPSGFDKAMETYQQIRRYRGSPSARHRRAAIILMGVGFGLMLLLGAEDGFDRSGLGVGGFVVILGLAFFVSSLLESSHDVPISRAYPGQPQSGYPPQPPSTSPRPPADHPPTA